LRDGHHIRVSIVSKTIALLSRPIKKFPELFWDLTIVSARDVIITYVYGTHTLYRTKFSGDTVLYYIIIIIYIIKLLNTTVSYWYLHDYQLSYYYNIGIIRKRYTDILSL